MAVKGLSTDSGKSSERKTVDVSPGSAQTDTVIRISVSK